MATNLVSDSLVRLHISDEEFAKSVLHDYDRDREAV